jgi:hypothetical protein
MGYGHPAGREIQGQVWEIERLSQILKGKRDF